MKSLAFCLALLLGTLTPLHASNQIKGNLLCTDGVTLVTSDDKATVEAVDASGSPALFTITYPTPSSYLIVFDQDKLPADKGVKITYKLDGVVQRTAEGINGNSQRPTQFLDVGMSKAGAKTNAVTKCIIKGSVFYKDGVTSPVGSDVVKIDGKDANDKALVPQIIGRDWAFSIDPKQLPANKTVYLMFTLNGTSQRKVQALSGTDVRTQVFDISFDK